MLMLFRCLLMHIFDKMDTKIQLQKKPKSSEEIEREDQGIKAKQWGNAPNAQREEIHVKNKEQNTLVHRQYGRASHGGKTLFKRKEKGFEWAQGRREGKGPARTSRENNEGNTLKGPQA